jgi:stage V sporulation protein SpoVS
MKFGAYYQAYLAQDLRASGADVALDQETGAARLTAIPEAVRTAFSKRTVDAVTIARKWAAEAGRDWDTLPAEEKIELAKRGSGVGRQSKDAKRTMIFRTSLPGNSRPISWDGNTMACCGTALRRWRKPASRE